MVIRSSRVHSAKREEINSSSESLSQGWDSVNNRLTYLYAYMIKLQKKTTKIELKLTKQADNVENIIENIIEKTSKSHPWYKDTLKEIRKYIGELWDSLNKISIERVNESQLDFGKQINEVNIDSKLAENFKQNQLYIDRAVYELKSLLKYYVQGQYDTYKVASCTSNKSRDVLGSYVPQKSNNLFYSQSRQKISRASNGSCEKDGLFEKEIMLDNKSSHSKKNSDSRMINLKSKLKYFEQINKKYEQKVEERGKMTIERGRNTYYKILDKMKHIRNYLYQSYSEIDQSNLIDDDHV